MRKVSYFGPKFFKFLRELRDNNCREWFLANKERYELDVRDPCLQFIVDFAARLQDISEHFRADPRPVGGSLFRVYRDVRFSKDKRPYKTMAAMHFHHEVRKDAHAPGFYLHLEPGNVFMGTGFWHPDTATLARIREALVAHSTRWKQVLSNREFKAALTLWGESLKRPPAGYDAKHPLIEDLKRKDFIAMAPLSEDEACAPGFMDRFTELCQVAAPFTKFLTTAAGLPW